MLFSNGLDPVELGKRSGIARRQQAERQIELKKELESSKLALSQTLEILASRPPELPAGTISRPAEPPLETVQPMMEVERAVKVDDFAMKRLRRVRKQLARLDKLADATSDSKTLREIAAAQESLAKQECLYARRPAVAAEKTTPARDQGPDLRSF